MENAHLALEQAKEELTYLYTFFARAYILYNKYKDLSKGEGRCFLTAWSYQNARLPLASLPRWGEEVKNHSFFCVGIIALCRVSVARSAVLKAPKKCLKSPVWSEK